MTLRRTAIKRKRARYPSPAKERYADCHGIPFDEYRFHLADRVTEWPKVIRVLDDDVEFYMHEMYPLCWSCVVDRPFAQAHHITGGTKGRSDEFTNIAMLCPECHANANTAGLPMGRILYLKWKHDRQHCDWVRIALLHRKHLPDLITK